MDSLQREIMEAEQKLKAVRRRMEEWWAEMRKLEAEESAAERKLEQLWRDADAIANDLASRPEAG